MCSAAIGERAHGYARDLHGRRLPPRPACRPPPARWYGVADMRGTPAAVPISTGESRGIRDRCITGSGSDTPVQGREVPGRSTLPAPPLRRVPATEPLRDSRETTTPFAANSSASCAWGSPSRRGRGRKGLEERLRSKCRPQVNDDSGWLLKWVAPDVRDPGWNDHRFAGVCNPAVLGPSDPRWRP